MLPHRDWCDRAALDAFQAKVAIKELCEKLGPARRQDLPNPVAVYLSFEPVLFKVTSGVQATMASCSVKCFFVWCERCDQPLSKVVP